MADSITSLITANLITDILKITTANGYNTNIAYCEQERLTERFNNRYPIVELAGPSIDVIQDESYTQGYKYILEYTAIYRDTLDDSKTSDNPVTYQARNVESDIIKGIMADHARGGYAIITYPTESYYALDFGPNNEPIFTVVLTFKVETFVKWNDPYTLG